LKVFEANISQRVSDFLIELLQGILTFEAANQTIFEKFGIKNFFTENDELETLKEVLSETYNLVEEPDRAEYGDFQTNAGLANRVCQHLASAGVSPEIIIEPTCGKGNFIIAALQKFRDTKHIFGVEIYKPYIWETKFGIINFFLENPEFNRPEITIGHCNVFDFNFKEIAKNHLTNEILIIGNPPWVTNSKLGSLNSSNLPRKNNFKNHSGLDALTGKGNFDIAENITLSLIETFQTMNGHLVLLVKNSVIKNIVFDQFKNQFKIASLSKENIDSKKEFDVSVEASLFFCKLNSKPEFYCKEFNFYDNNTHYQTFGWVNNKFVSNIETYLVTQNIDGKSPFEWRQGLKHDCATIMEFEKENGGFINGQNEQVNLEEGLVYGLLKSSDLKNTVIYQTRKFTVVTQKKVGQSTNYIKTEFPKTYKYLAAHQASFDARKSSIYLNKPLFSIFGIGDYSFKPFKVAISGLYKTFHFTLVLPQENKPVMLDDTCYFIGFDKIEYAVYALILLNSEPTMRFLQSITFQDAKRTFTKDVLMRIDLLSLAKNIQQTFLLQELSELNKKYSLDLTLGFWKTFIDEMTPVNTGQIEMF
jgi:hypothetical protein